MKTILCFGSCRSSEIPSNKYKIYNVTYTHSTKEVIQLLSYSFNNIEKQNNILQQKYILNDMTLEKFNQIKNIYDSCDFILIEISSIKEIKNDNGYYYNQWVVRDNNINENIIINFATIDEIVKDIEIIKKILNNKKIIFQSHINLNFEGMETLKHKKIIPPIESRTIIDEAIKKIEHVQKIIPRELFFYYNWKDIVVSDTDTCHMSIVAKNIIADYLDNVIK